MGSRLWRTWFPSTSHLAETAKQTSWPKVRAMLVTGREKCVCVSGGGGGGVRMCERVCVCVSVRASVCVCRGWVLCCCCCCCLFVLLCLLSFLFIFSPSLVHSFLFPSSVLSLFVAFFCPLNIIIPFISEIYILSCAYFLFIFYFPHLFPFLMVCLRYLCFSFVLYSFPSVLLSFSWVT